MRRVKQQRKKPTKQSMPVILLALWTLTACQTPSAPASSDVTQLQKAAVEAAVTEVCRGQEPRALDTIAWCDGPRDASGKCLGIVVDGVTIQDYRAAPEWARTYVLANDDQYVQGCPEASGR